MQLLFYPNCFISIFVGNIIPFKINETLALQSQAIINAPIIELDEVDSTNNYAMGLLNADKAYNGLTVVARRQTGGKGQRGRTWQDVPGQSLLMTVITVPPHGLDEQFSFMARVAVTLVQALQQTIPMAHVAIKWPNDIIVNDKKAGGILIENIIRGSHWAFALIGFGLNVAQSKMDEALPYATSLKIETGSEFLISDLVNTFRAAILNDLSSGNTDLILNRYNELLFRRGRVQRFGKDDQEWQATVKHVNKDGTLQVALDDGTLRNYTHGTENWIWA